MTFERRRGMILVLRDSEAPSGGIGVRLFGLVVLVGAGYAVRAVLSESVSWRAWAGAGCLGWLALGGLAMLVHVSDMTVNLLSRSYVRREGLWPLVRYRRGGLNDIEAIRVTRKTEQRANRAGMYPVSVTVAALHWKDPRTRPLSFVGTVEEPTERKGRDAVLADARTLGQLTGIPVLPPTKGAGYEADAR